MDLRDVDVRVKALAIEIANQLNALRDELLLEIVTGGTGASFPWSNITGRPAVFPPASHVHPASEITDFDSASEAAILAYLDAGSGITLTEAAGRLVIAAEAAEALGDTLEAIQALTGAANKLAYFTGADTAALADLTAFGRLLIGAGLTASANQLLYLDGDSLPALGSITAFGRSLVDDADAAAGRVTLGAARGDGGFPVESFILAASDETTDLTTGTNKVRFRIPYAFTVSAVRASLSTASSSGLVTVDINEDGASILSTKLTIDASETTSTTAATAVVISDASLADDAEITVDIDGAGTGAKGLKVTIIGRRTA